MKFTDAARDLLKHLEGCRLEAYLDEAEKWTIGYGHRGDVHRGMTITQHQADVIFDLDLDRFILGVEHYVDRAHLSDEQFSALVIFAFNVGLIGFAGSTALRDLQLGQLGQVPHELGRWIYVHDKSGVPLVSKVLVARRQAEIALWNSPA
jgi:lysozyme